ncbi:MAG: alpha/beta hydrolase [Burkholderiaceae bacterium]|nr:alpha/beta hydrolase [Burkholderiaceae bacterium]
MRIDLHGAAAYAYTGGKTFDPALPTVVLIHGAQNDHSVWALQSRYLAHHGHSVLAVDLPGHGRSQGAALPSVEAMADWLLALLAALGVTRAALVGHSMGALIALETVYKAPDRVTKLALLGCTFPMKVSDALLNTARDNEAAAIDMVNLFSHSTMAQKPSCPGPGFSVMGGARRLMQRMSQINPEQLFYTDFYACNAYANGDAAARSLGCPALFIFGAKDVMTSPKSAKGLLAAIPHARTVTVDAGHSMMQEQPDAVLDALVAFLP